MESVLFGGILMLILLKLEKMEEPENIIQLTLLKMENILIINS